MFVMDAVDHGFKPWSYGVMLSVIDHGFKTWSCGVMLSVFDSSVIDHGLQTNCIGDVMGLSCEFNF